MEIAFTDQEIRFRDEVSEFIAENYSQDMRDKSKRSLTGYLDNGRLPGTDTYCPA